MMKPINVKKPRVSVFAVIGALFVGGMSNSILSADGSNSVAMPIRVFIAGIVAAGVFLLIAQLYPRSVR